MGLHVGRPLPGESQEKIEDELKAMALARTRRRGLEAKFKAEEWEKREREATAVIEVKRGDDAKTLYLEEGDKGTAHGVRVEVTAAGEVYDEETMRWPAFADVKVTAR